MTDLLQQAPTEEEREKVRQIDALTDTLDSLTHSYFLIYTMGPDQDIGWIHNGEFYHLAGLLQEAMHQHWKLGEAFRPVEAKGT